MSDNDTGSFRLGTLDETRGTAPVEDSDVFELEVGKINRRFRWLLVLTFLVVVGLFIAGYFDLKNRFSVQKTSGTREIENIAAVFQDRLDELEKRFDEFEATMTKELAALDQKTVVSQKDLAALRQSVDKLDLSGAVKKEQKALLESVRKQIAPLDQNVKILATELAALDQKFQAQIPPLSTSLTQAQETIDRIQAQIGPTSGQIVQKDQMDLELLKIKKAYRQNIAAEIAGLEKQMRILKDRMERLEIKPPSGAAAPGPTGQAPSVPTTAGNTGIQEQNIP